VAIPGGNSSLFEFVLNLLIDSILISSIFVLGEEVGWRGYMLPRLLPLGAIRAVLLSGLLHGIWHFPMIFLTPYYHAEGNRFVVIPLFLLTLTLGGVFYGYLRLTTNSIWPVILFHGVWNTTYSGLNSLIVTDSPLVTEYLTGESGLITLLSAIIVTAGLWYLLRKRPQMAVLAA
jgi:membrane protease YdiL (CAAX protease family)